MRSLRGLLAVILLCGSTIAFSATTWWASQSGIAYPAYSNINSSCQLAVAGRNQTHPSDTCTFTSATDTACFANCTQSGSGVQVANNHKVVDGTCPASGTLFSSGYYDVGTDPNSVGPAASNFPFFQCSSAGCEVTISGSVQKSYLVSGVRHYIFVGYMTYDGYSCGSTGTAKSSLTSIPASSYGTDQIAVTVNGAVKCYNRDSTTSTGQCGTTTANSTVTNGDGSKTVTTTTTDSCAGTTSTATQTYPAGTTPPSGPSSTFTPGQDSGSGSGSGSGTGTGTTNDPGSMGNYCASHPDAGACRTGNAIAEYCAANPNAEICQAHQTENTTPDPDSTSLGTFSDAFFSGTFTNLLAWRLPAHSSTCPSLSLDLFGGTASMTSHCTVVQSIQTDYGNVMLLVWTLVALFIVLGA